MPKMHLRQPGIICSVYGPFTKSKERIQKFEEIEIHDIFQHDMAYGDFKDLLRRTASDKIVQDKAFNIAKSSKYDG